MSKKKDLLCVQCTLICGLKQTNERDRDKHPKSKREIETKRPKKKKKNHKEEERSGRGEKWLSKTVKRRETRR